MGFSHCRFQECDARQELGSRDLTDGEWVWPEGLAHYVDHHRISLPPSFIEKAINDLSQAAPKVDPDSAADDSAWVTWAVDVTHPPEPDSTPASSEEVMAMAEQLGSAKLEIRPEPAGERWKIAFVGPQSCRTDYIPRLSQERLEAYLMAWREPDPAAVLSAADATLVVEGILGRRTWREKVATAFGRGGLLPTLRDVKPSAIGGPQWHVTSGTTSGPVPAQDEIGLRYILRSMASEWGSFLDAI